MFLKTSYNIGCHVLKVCGTKAIYCNLTRNIYANCTKLSNTTSNHEVKSVESLSEYADKQLFHHKVKEIEPATPTIKEILSQADADSILNIVEENYQQNKFFDDELHVYFSKLFYILRPNIINLRNESLPIIREITAANGTFDGTLLKNELVSNVDTGLVIGPNLEAHNHILNDGRFQILLKQTLLTCQLLPSRDLSQIYRLLTLVGTPIYSYTYQHLVSTIQTKINEFSVRDVSICLSTQTHHFYVNDAVSRCLRAGFMLHLENMVVDEDVFLQSCSEMPFYNILYLYKYGGRYGSHKLKRLLWKACYSMYKRRNLPLTIQESVLIIFLSRWSNCSHRILLQKADKILENTGLNAVTSIPGMACNKYFNLLLEYLNPRQKELLAKVNYEKHLK